MMEDYDSMEWVPNNDPERGPKSKDEIVRSAVRFFENPEEWTRGYGLNSTGFRGNGYNVALQNCENFSLACVYKKPPLLSDQTKGVLKAGAAVAVGAAFFSAVERNHTRKKLTR